MLAYTIAAELGDVGRFPTPRKLVGYSGRCPRVYQSGERDLRGPLAKQGPHYSVVRWSRPPPTPARGRPTVSATRTRKRASASSAAPRSRKFDLARRLAEAIWHMLTREQPFAPKGATDPLAA